MVKMLQILPEKCTGCMQCELACSWVQTGTFQPSQSLIRVNVFDEQASYAPFACVQCDEAWCMNTCPTNAIAMDAGTGAENYYGIAVHWLSSVHDCVSVWDGLDATGKRQSHEVQSVRR